MRWFSLWIFLYIIVFGTNGIIVPDEVPTALSVIYSNIPKIKIGTDSRIGWGFRFGDRADGQILLELGPQQETQRLANQQPFDNPNYPELSSSLDSEDYDIASDEPEQEDLSPKEETAEREGEREEEKIELDHKNETEVAVIKLEIQAMSNLLSKVNDKINTILGRNQSKTEEKKYQIMNDLIRTLKNKISEEKEKLINFEEDTSSTVVEKFNPILEENELKEITVKLKKYIERTSIDVKNETDFLTIVEIEKLKKLLDRLSTMQIIDHTKKQRVLNDENDMKETDEENNPSIVSEIITKMKEHIDFNSTEKSPTKFIGSTHSASEDNSEELPNANSSTENKYRSDKTKFEINNNRKTVGVDYPLKKNITEQQLQMKKGNETETENENFGTGLKKKIMESEELNEKSDKFFTSKIGMEEYITEEYKTSRTEDKLLSAEDENSSMNSTTYIVGNTVRTTSKPNDNFSYEENEDMLRKLNSKDYQLNKTDVTLIKLDKIQNGRKNSLNSIDTMKKGEIYKDIQQGKNVELLGTESTEEQHRKMKNSLVIGEKINNHSDFQNVKVSVEKNEVIFTPDEKKLNSIENENEIDFFEKDEMLEILKITLINQVKHLTEKSDNQKQILIGKILKILEEEKANIFIGNKGSVNQRRIITNKNGIILRGPYKGVKIEAYKTLSVLWASINLKVSKSTNNFMNKIERKPEVMVMTKNNTNSAISTEYKVTNNKTEKSHNNSDHRIVTDIAAKKYKEENEIIFANKSSEPISKSQSPNYIHDDEFLKKNIENYREITKGIENKLMKAYGMNDSNITNIKGKNKKTNNKNNNIVEKNSRKPEKIKFDSIAKTASQESMISMDNAQKLSNVTKSISRYMTKSGININKIDKVLNQTKKMQDEEYRETMLAMRKAQMQNHIIGSSKTHFGNSVKSTQKLMNIVLRNTSRSKMMSKNPIIYKKNISTHQERNNMEKKSTGATLKLLGVKVMNYFSNILQNTKKKISARNKNKK